MRVRNKVAQGMPADIDRSVVDEFKNELDKLIESIEQQGLRLSVSR